MKNPILILILIAAFYASSLVLRTVEAKVNTMKSVQNPISNLQSQ